MAGRSAARRALVGIVGVAAAVLAACSSGPVAGTPPVPTFPGPGAAPTTSAPAPRSTLLPTDCNQILSKDQMPNLLGLPLGSVDVRALRDVPAPSVGRLERVTCNYTSLGGPGAPNAGQQVLKIIASGYTDPQSAVAQAEVNNRVEEQSGVAAVPTPIGAAQATYFDDPDGPVLVVVYARVTTSLTLTRGGPISGEQARSVLVDLAQRALPVLVPQGQ